MNDVWLAVDRDGAETISAYKPNYDGFEWDDYQFLEEEGYVSTTIVLPTGSIKKLLGKELTLQDSPIRIEEELDEL